MISRYYAVLIVCMVMAALNFSYVLVFMPTGHDDVAQRLTHSQKNAEHFRSQHRKMSITMETIDALEGSEEIQRVIIFADEFEPPFITRWTPLKT